MAVHAARVRDHLRGARGRQRRFVREIQDLVRDVGTALVEDELRARGANYVQAGLWRGFAVRDGNLITGQQNFSGEETARLVVAALGE